MGVATTSGSPRLRVVPSNAAEIHIGAFARHAFNNDAFYVSDLVRVVTAGSSGRARGSARVSGGPHIE